MHHGVEDGRSIYHIKYNLIEDQEKVVHTMEKWFTNFNCSNPGLLPSKPEICQIIFLMSTFKDRQAMRILISVATNVAMDRVLPGLLELGFNDFISIKRIARNIFPYSLWTRSDVNGVEYATLRKMHDQMMEESIDERLEIEEELKSLWEAKIAKHKRNSKMYKWLVLPGIWRSIHDQSNLEGKQVPNLF